MSEITRADDLTIPLRKKFGFRGATGFDLQQEVQPVIVVGDIEGAPWNTKVGGLGGLDVAAVAAQFTYVGLFARTSLQDNYRGVCRRIFVSIPGVASAAIIRVGVLNQYECAAVGFTTQDPRGSWDSVPALTQATDLVRPTAQIISANTVTGLLTDANSLQLLAPGETGANRTLEIPGPFTVAPGNALLVQTEGLNVALRAAFYWDEFYAG